MNVVLVKSDGTLVTPDSDSILEGITRDSILQLAEDRGLTVEKRRVTLDEWRDGVDDGSITEAFACGTAAVVTPIAELRGDGFTIGSPTVGAGSLTMSLRDEPHRHPVRPSSRPARVDDQADRRVLIDRRAWVGSNGEDRTVQQQG